MIQSESHLSVPPLSPTPSCRFPPFASLFYLNSFPCTILVFTLFLPGLFAVSHHHSLILLCLSPSLSFSDPLSISFPHLCLSCPFSPSISHSSSSLSLIFPKFSPSLSISLPPLPLLPPSLLSVLPPQRLFPNLLWPSPFLNSFSPSLSISLTPLPSFSLTLLSYPLFPLSFIFPHFFLCLTFPLSSSSLIPSFLCLPHLLPVFSLFLFLIFHVFSLTLHPFLLFFIFFLPQSPPSQSLFFHFFTFNVLQSLDEHGQLMFVLNHLGVILEILSEPGWLTKKWLYFLHELPVANRASQTHTESKWRTQNIQELCSVAPRQTQTKH